MLFRTREGRLWSLLGSRSRNNNTIKFFGFQFFYPGIQVTPEGFNFKIGSQIKELSLPTSFMFLIEHAPAILLNLLAGN